MHHHALSGPTLLSSLASYRPSFTLTTLSEVGVADRSAAVGQKRFHHHVEEAASWPSWQAPTRAGRCLRGAFGEAARIFRRFVRERAAGQKWRSEPAEPSFLLAFDIMRLEADLTTVQINARVHPAVKKAIDDYCRSRGIVVNHFVQAALIDRLEELEDIEDLKAIRHEPTRPLKDVLAELGLDG